MAPPRDDLDQVLDSIGMGSWQVLGLVANVIIMFVVAVYTIGTTFFNPPMSFFCSRTGNITNESILLLSKLGDNTTEVWNQIFDNHCLQEDNETSRLQAFLEAAVNNISEATCVNCQTMANATKNTSEALNTYEGLLSSLAFYETGMDSCPFAIYDDALYDTTIMTEWSLICDRSKLFSFFQDFYSYGLILGCAFGGELADRFGRVRTTLIGSITNGIANIVVAVVPNFETVIIGRFVIGLTGFMIYICTLTWSVETCPVKYRGPIGMFTGLAFPLGVAIFALLASLIKPWRQLYIVSTWPILLLIPIAWLMDPSPRWLLQKMRLEMTKDVLWKMAKKNKRGFKSREEVEETMRDVLTTVPIEEIEQQERGLAKEVLNSPCMMHIFVISPLLQFFTKVTYYAVFFYSVVFATSSPFLFMALTGIANFFGTLLGIPIMEYWGRKHAAVGTILVNGLLMLVNLGIPKDITWAQWTMFLTAFMLCSCATQSQYVYTSELFPTVVRARGLAFGTLLASVGSLTAPFLTWYLEDFGWWVTGTTLAMSSIIAGLIGLSLPETSGVFSCETIWDVERRAIYLRRKYGPGLIEQALTAVNDMYGRPSEDGENAENFLLDQCQQEPSGYYGAMDVAEDEVEADAKDCKRNGRESKLTLNEIETKHDMNEKYLE